jgi:deoxycytidylate deaminase
VFYGFVYNQYNINKKAGLNNNNSIHAEMDCLKKLKKQVNKTSVDVLIFRITNTKDYLNAKPCIACYNSIISLLEKKKYDLKNIYYTNNNEIHTL